MSERTVDETKCPKCGSSHLGGLMDAFWVEVDEHGQPILDWAAMSSETEVGVDRMCYDCNWSSQDDERVELESIRRDSQLWRKLVDMFDSATAAALLIDFNDLLNGESLKRAVENLKGTQ